jgi:hypothetical protein
MVNYIFLDIDGVLNTTSDWKVPYSINPHCVENFYRYVKKLGDGSTARIILISSWRDGFDKEGNHLPQVQHLIDMLSQYHLSIYDKTYKSPTNDRQREIEQYIIKNHINPEQCIIIDDDISLYHDLSKYKHIVPNPDEGFQVKKGWHK